MWNVFTWSRKLRKPALNTAKGGIVHTNAMYNICNILNIFGYLRICTKGHTQIFCLYFVPYCLVFVLISVLFSLACLCVFGVQAISLKILLRTCFVVFFFTGDWLCRSCKLLHTDPRKEVNSGSLLKTGFAIKYARIMQGNKHV